MGTFNKSRVMSANEAAKLDGLSIPPDMLSAKECPYCHKKLYRLCIVGGLISGCVVTPTYENCDCPEGEAAARREEDKRREAEHNAKTAQEQERLKRRIERAFRRSEMPPRWEGYTLAAYECDDDGERNALQRSRNFTSWFLQAHRSRTTGDLMPNGIMFAGDCGTGKTHLAAGILNAVMAQAPDIPVIGATMGEMLAKLRSSYGDGGATATEEDVIKAYISAPLLLIDDLGSEQITEWAADRIYTIINGRYNANAPTIVTTNYLRDQDLARRLSPPTHGTEGGKRIADRLSEMCSKIELRGDSRRAKLSTKRSSRPHTAPNAQN